MNKNKMEILGGTLAGMMFLSGCAPTTEIIATETAMAVTETPEVIVTPIVTQELPTEPLITATDEVTATPPEVTQIQIESTTGIKSEFLLDGNLKIDKEAGDKYYRDFVDSLAGNEQNKDYMEGLLGANPNGTKLLDYLKKNDYTLPPGLNLPYMIRPSIVKIDNNPISESIRLDTLKIVVYGSSQWNSDLGGVKEYISSLKTYGGLWTADGSFSNQCFGWAIDLSDNRLVMVAGAKEVAPEKYPNTEKMTIGGFDGSFDYNRDALVASGELIQINKLFKVYNPKSDAFSFVAVFSTLCGVQDTSGICDLDVAKIFGQGKTMFEPGK